MGIGPTFLLCKHATLGALVHLFCLSTWSSFAKYAQTRGMRPTDNQKKILFVVSCSLLKSLYWTIHQQEFTPQNVATSSSKYHSPLKTPNSILQGKSRHHQNRRRPGKYWKAKVHVSNHICLKQDKTPQHSHNETHETQGLEKNQIQPSQHTKHTKPTSTS